MQPAEARTVLGDFDGAAVSTNGGPVRLFQRDGHYFAHATGPDGVAADFQVRYTLGVFPLQQYLVALPDGHIQALASAWDSRPKAQGGQRWIGLYPERVLAPGDVLHWTGRDQNWNFMCATCHTTDLQRNYDAATARSQTTWSEAHVGCEACHGPGAGHLAWARDPAHGPANKGLTVMLQASRQLQWGFWQPAQRIATPRGPVAVAAAQSETCFPCHARRQPLSEAMAPGRSLLDSQLPQLIEAGVYHADGQIDAEDFEFGSFAQSRMYGAGVTCTNCHDAHDLKLRATGNTLCTQCHRADVYDVSAHHHHRAQTEGSSCVSCHMPAKTYMGVDRRRDHSFRIPRPDLSVQTGVPNTCNACHADRKPEWAAAAIKGWTGHDPATAMDFAAVFDDIWSGADATSGLLRVTAQGPSPMVRASALALLPQTGAQTREVVTALSTAIHAREGLIRLGAARGLAVLEPAQALRIGAPLLGDPLKAVRVEAARSLAGSADAHTPPPLAADLDRAIAELMAVERSAAERPESYVNRAQIESRLGRDADAERELRAALRLDPRFVPAMVNLADLDRSRGREANAEQWLRRAVSIAPTAAEPAHALGLLEVRNGHLDQALTWLKQAAALDGGNARYSYVYAVALAEAGRKAEAQKVVKAARQRAPKDASLLALEQQLLR